ncbi:CHAT domain-containing protein [Scytonema sp. UIC 10036]|nr:CHAT domain-containing protein [Scytonema sp. UIC 10036]
MNEQSQETYRKLIDALLKCSSSQEINEILNSNRHLIDAGLLQMMQQVAQELAEKGNENAANFLRDVSCQLSEVLRLSSTTTFSQPQNPNSQLDLLLQLLQAIHYSNNNPKVLYSLLQDNLRLLNDNCASVLHNWATTTLPRIVPEQAQELAADIVNFSIFIRKLPLGNQASNIEIAIAGYKVAATVFTREAFPQEWASVQNNLGIAYRNRIRGEKAENLEQAIGYYLAALRVCTHELYPYDWSMTQQNLGIVYQNRIRGEQAENIEAAIRCFQAALKVRTRQAFPQDWAMTQHNLGIAYSNRIRGKRSENLEAAICCFQAALEVRSREVNSQEWAMTQNNLGIAYYESIKGEKAENLEAAIRCFQAALEVYTREASAHKWAMLHNNLGNAYSHRICGEKAENLETAIRCFKAALEIRTRRSFPEEWSTTQNNLGDTYRKRINGEKLENLEIAIRHLKATLEVRTCEAFPLLYVETQFNLGLAYQDAGRFSDAYNAFTAAIDTLESLRGEIVFGSAKEEDKQKLAEKWNKVYEFAVEVCLELENSTKAIEYVERSKTRNLVELILSRNIQAIFPKEIVRQLEQLQDEISTSQYQLQTATAEVSTALTQHLSQLRQQRNELQNQYLPLGSGFKFDQFRVTLDRRTAIVQFYVARNKFLVFIFTCQTQQPIVWQSEPKDLKKLMYWVAGYMGAYYEKKSHWHRRLSTRLHLLGKILHLEEIIKLIPDSCERLILIPHQYLHLFPLHALPVTEKSSLLDLFPQGVSYSPSCQLFQLAQRRKLPDFTSFFAVHNPTKDLGYTNIEVETIQRYFGTTNVLKEEMATREAIDDISFTNAHCTHFSCHGYFHPNQPRQSGLILTDAYLDTAPTEINSEQYLTLPDGKVLDLDKCLTLEKIFTLNLDQCPLVTLSACETGLIDFRNISDEYIGLPSGFLYAGAISVVSSLWTVNDLSTAFLMIQFYQNLQKGLAVALALNQAQLWLKNLTKVELEKWIEENRLPLSPVVKMNLRRRLYKLESDTKPFQSPFYWAAFCATGQ